MSSNRSKDRSSLCSFTFADGRQCRMPRRDGHADPCQPTTEADSEEEAYIPTSVTPSE